MAGPASINELDGGPGLCFTWFDDDKARNPSETDHTQRHLGRFDIPQQQRAICRRILSPLHRFPPELLGEVFAFAINPASDLVASNGGRKQLLILCLVSRGWRDAAYARHDLWNSLELTSPFEDDMGVKAQKFLDRSGVLPKSISIRVTTNTCSWECVGDDTCSLSSQTLARFLVEGPLIQNLWIDCASSECVQRLLECMEKIKPLGQSRSWDSVTNLRLTVESEWCEEEDNDHQGANPSIRMFTQFPSALRSLYLHLPPSKQVGTDVSLDLPAGFCAQLRELTLVCDWEADKVLSALKLCTDLETFALDADYVRFDFEADNPWQARTEEQTTLLTTVRRLSLLNIHPEASAFLDFFRPYALEELSLDFTSGLDWLGCRGVPSLLDYFEPFIRRSEEKGTFHLRRLRLTGIEIDAEDMLSILLNLPSLTHLALNTVWVPSTLFRDLLEIETVVPLPHLRELTLRDLPHEFLVWDVRVYVEGRQTLMMEDGNRLAQTTLSIDGTLHAVNGCLVPFFETQRTESDEWDSDEEESDEEEGELENKGNHGERLMSVDEDEGGMA